MTDEASYYRSIASHFPGWTHATCCHSKFQWVNKASGATVNAMENFWSVLKRKWDGTDVDGFLAEQIFKWNLAADGVLRLRFHIAMLEEIAKQFPPSGRF